MPSLGGVSGTLTLEPEPSPFGMAVDAEGHQRLRLVVHIAGLPSPRTMGGATAFVAWIASVTMDSVTSLGVVGNGRTDLGVTVRDQFRVLVSAERAAVATRGGPLLLRAVSPSARLLAHRDLRSLPLGPAAPAPDAASVGVHSDSAMAHDHGAMHATTPDRWLMPAMPATMPMMPSVRGLVPGVEPFNPGRGADPMTFARAGAATTLRPATGDTITLTAALVRRELDGRPYTGYAFNGEVPGPLIRVRQGGELVVKFRNEADLPGSIHWHGLRLDNGSDGAVGSTQPAVAPGGTFIYHLRFPDAGTLWYHGHVREDIQLARGLAGNIVVEAADGAISNDAGTTEEVLLLGDLLTDGRDPLAAGASAPTHALSGRVGDRALVNGAPRIARTRPAGSVMRVRLTNASAARLFNISWPGAGMVLLGSDLGPFEREQQVESVVIAPGERYLLDI